MCTPEQGESQGAEEQSFAPFLLSHSRAFHRFHRFIRSGADGDKLRRERIVMAWTEPSQRPSFSTTSSGRRAETWLPRLALELVKTHAGRFPRQASCWAGWGGYRGIGLGEDSNRVGRRAKKNALLESNAFFVRWNVEAYQPRSPPPRPPPPP